MWSSVSCCASMLKRICRLFWDLLNIESVFLIIVAKMKCSYGYCLSFVLTGLLLHINSTSSHQMSMPKFIKMGNDLHKTSRAHGHFSHLTTMKHIAKLTKHFGPHIGPLLGVAAGGVMTVVGVGIVHSPLSPFPVPHLPLPPVGRHPIKHVLHYPKHYDIVPKGYHYLPPIQHPKYNNLEYGVYGNVGQNSIWYWVPCHTIQYINSTVAINKLCESLSIWGRETSDVR